MRGPGMMAWLAGKLAALRGDDGVLDYAIAFPVVMALIAAIVQAMLFFAARNAAIAAAQQGVSTGRLRGGTAAEGAAAACSYAQTAGAGFLRAPACTGAGGATVTVRVCGDAPSILPGIPVRACAAASGPAERFTVP